MTPTTHASSDVAYLCRALKAPSLARAYERLAERARTEEWTHVEFLAAWLYLNDGRNGTRQVVPAQFVADATRADTTTDPASEYQYLWWIDDDRGAFFGSGDHGQFIYVDPNADLVIVRHGRGLADLDWVRFIGDLAEWIDLQLSSP